MENHDTVSDWDAILTWPQIVQMPADVNLPAVPQFDSSDPPQYQLLHLDVQTPSPPPYNAWQQTFLEQEHAYVDHAASQVVMQALAAVQVAPFEAPIAHQDTWSQSFPVQEDTDPSQFETSSPPESPEDTEPPVSRCHICNVVFYRRQERNRHMRSFLPLSIYCPFEQCSWRGERHDNLKKHWSAKHTHVQFPEQQPCQIYSPDPLVELVVRERLSIESAAGVALYVVGQRAHELNKIGIWQNWWGRKPKNFDH